MPVAEIHSIRRVRRQPIYHDVESPPIIPMLENGDHLTREEFERRYNAMPCLKKAELIKGRVYMSSAVKIDHSSSHAKIMAWLGAYWVATPGTDLHDNGTVRLDEDNEPQPDAVLRVSSPAIGATWTSDDGYLEGAPELIVEVSGSSASYDLHEKREVYRRHGVQEYLIWQMYENRLEWLILEDETYLTLRPDSEGMLRSRVFPGLWLALDALLSGDMATVVAVLQHGLDTEEHAAFAQRLQKAATPTR